MCARAGVTMQDLTDVRLGKSIWSRGGEGRLSNVLFLTATTATASPPRM